MQATEEEQAAIQALLSKGAESAPAGAGIGRASALAWAGLRLAAIVLLAAGVGVGLGDGNEFDDVGCSVAQRPAASSHDARSAQARERPSGKMPDSDNGSAGGSGDGQPGRRPGCEARVGMCAHRMADGQCRSSNQQCRLLDGAGGAGQSRDLEVAAPGVAAQAVVKAVEDAMERFEGSLAGLRKDLADWQKCPSAASEAGQAALSEPSPPDEPNLSFAAKVLKLLKALDPGNRLRKAPPLTVFNLFYQQRLRVAEIARECRCDRSLIHHRLAAIRAKIPWTPEQLREISPLVEAMQDAATDSRARRIYRKGAAYGDEEDGAEPD